MENDIFCNETTEFFDSIFNSKFRGEFFLGANLKLKKPKSKAKKLRAASKNFWK